jgi:hypothetical protein
VDEPSAVAAARACYVRQRLLVGQAMMHLLLAAQLQHLAVGVGVLGHHERRARRRPVLRHEAARLVPDAARVAERLGAHGPRPPLRRLVRLAVQAPPALPRRRRGRSRRRVLLLGGLGRLLCQERRRGAGAGLGRRDGRGPRRGREHKEARGPAAWSDARTLAARLGRRRHAAAGVRRGRRRSRSGRLGSRWKAGDESQLPEVLRREVVLAHAVGQPFQLRQLIVLRRDSEHEASQQLPTTVIQSTPGTAESDERLGDCCIWAEGFITSYYSWNVSSTIVLRKLFPPRFKEEL